MLPHRITFFNCFWLAIGPAPTAIRQPPSLAPASERERGRLEMSQNVPPPSNCGSTESERNNQRNDVREKWKKLPPPSSLSPRWHALTALIKTEIVYISHSVILISIESIMCTGQITFLAKRATDIHSHTLTGTGMHAPMNGEPKKHIAFVSFISHQSIRNKRTENLPLRTNNQHIGTHRKCHAPEPRPSEPIKFTIAFDIDILSLVLSLLTDQTVTIRYCLNFSSVSIRWHTAHTNHSHKIFQFFAAAAAAALTSLFLLMRKHFWFEVCNH